MTEVTRVVIVEDSLADLALMERELRRAQMVIATRHVLSEEGLLEALDTFAPDIILSDHSLPQFGARDVLRISRELKLEVPVIVVTGSLNEETAVDYIKDGATDYIVKHHLERLGPAVQRATAARRASQERSRTEDKLRVSEEALRAAQNRLTQVVGASVAVIYATDAVPGAFVPNWISDNVTRLTGYTPEEALTPSWWLSHVHPEDRERVITELTDLISRGQFATEYRFQYKDGSYRWVLDEARLQRDPDGRPVEVIGTWIDIDDRKNLEIQLRQSQKMEAMGQLAGGIAHDFNNMLTAITGNADLLMDRIAVGDPAREDLEEIRSAATRAAGLTRRLLAFSRRQVIETQTVSLEAVLTGIDRMLHRVIGEDIDLLTVSAKDTGLVEADAGQIEQVILNLAINARDAMPKGGKLTIEVGEVSIDEDYARAHPPTVPGRFVQLAVTDTGEGMTDEVKARVFEPFFTTKEVGRGTGLGLAMVYGIVKQAGGFIWVYSEVGEGTTIKVNWPRVEANETQLLVEHPVAAPGRGSETILLVEDEAPVGKVAREILERHGYTVLEARRPDEALAICASHAEPIHLVISDVVMPGMNGHELTTRLLEARPSLKVLYISGYPGEAIAHRGVLPADTPFLSKPFTAFSLAHKVREVLSSPGGTAPGGPNR